MVMRQVENDELSDGLVSQLEELELFSRFILDNPSLVELPQRELENLFLEQRTNELSGGTLPTIAVGGTGEENIRERNALLHDRLQTLKTVRVRDGLTVGEALASRTEFGGGFLFPAITDAFEADPSSNAALFSFTRQLFTSPVGISEDPRARSVGISLSDLPAPVRVLTSAAQTTLSPGSIGVGVAAPGLIAARGVTPQSGRIVNLLAETPGRAVLTDFVGNLGADVAAELNAPPALQFAAGLLSGFSAGQLADFNTAVRTDGLQKAADAFIGPGALRRLGGAAEEAALSALITSVPPAVPFELLSALAQGELEGLKSEAVLQRPLNDDASQILDDINALIELRKAEQTTADAVRESNAVAAEEEALLKPFTQAAQELANAEARRERELREAEARARARRESAGIGGNRSRGRGEVAGIQA